MPDSRLMDEYCTTPNCVQLSSTPSLGNLFVEHVSASTNNPAQPSKGATRAAGRSVKPEIDANLRQEDPHGDSTIQYSSAKGQPHSQKKAMTE